MGAKTLAVARIETKGGTQSRAELNGAVVEEYADIIREGGKLPPVLVFYDGEKYWLADGFHRVEAHKRAGKDMVRADIRQGTREDAVWESCGANKAHGLRRSKGDVAIAVEMALRLKGEELSDAQIAEHVGCSRRYVGVIRGRLPRRNSSDLRTGADGKSYDTSGVVEANRRRAEEQRAERGRQERVRVVSEGAQEEPEEEVYTRCEGCGAQATCRDADDVDLCDGCMQAARDAHEAREEGEGVGDFDLPEEPEQQAPAPRPAAAALAEVPFLQEIGAALAVVRQRIQKAIERYNAAEQRDLHALRVLLGRFPGELKQLEHNLRAGLPAEVCPYCKGTYEECPGCRGAGWVSREAFERAPEVLRTTDKLAGDIDHWKGDLGETHNHRCRSAA